MLETNFFSTVPFWGSSYGATCMREKRCGGCSEFEIWDPEGQKMF